MVAIFVCLFDQKRAKQTLVKALLISQKKIGVSDTVGQYLLVVRKPDLNIDLYPECPGDDPGAAVLVDQLTHLHLGNHLQGHHSQADFLHVVFMDALCFKDVDFEQELPETN